ncbi:MAG TPA: hypothetical protein VFP65_14130 [Anaeromyxobacteraceae bacterium]|nr:hypothetical protein [Anaeromyxobacteraceae bacterium]
MKTRIGIALALATAAAAAHAHDLTCAQTVNGAPAVALRRYPAKLHFQIEITNVHPSDASTADRTRAPLLERLGFTLPATPFTIPVGGSARFAFDAIVPSRAACEALAAGLPMPADHAPYGMGGDDHGDGDDACDDDGEHGHDDGHHGEGDHRGHRHGWVVTGASYGGGDGHGGEGDHHGDDGEPHGACAGGLCSAGAFLDSLFAAGFDLGEAQCRARILCGGGVPAGDDHQGDDHPDDDRGHGDDDHHHGSGGMPAYR